jgi:DNA-cytosine methyltransferase
MKHASLFSGIGGFDLAAQWCGFDNVFNCEIDETCRKLLKYYWPNSDQLGDITKQDFNLYANKIDILTGGFPCQPFSNSGEQLGEKDTRYLYNSMHRAIREIKPRWVIGENVFSITSPKFNKVFEHIYSSLESEGYQVQPFVIPATATEAEHERYRVWIVAYSGSLRLQRSWENNRQMQPTEIGNRKTSRFVNFVQKNSMPFMCSSHNGLPRRLAEQTLHGAGNAIVPQIAYTIFKTILDFESAI